jgi:hypothetical protein
VVERVLPASPARLRMAGKAAAVVSKQAAAARPAALVKAAVEAPPARLASAAVAVSAAAAATGDLPERLCPPLALSR